MKEYQEQDETIKFKNLHDRIIFLETHLLIKNDKQK